jgi:hypothetical protein
VLLPIVLFLLAVLPLSEARAEGVAACKVREARRIDAAQLSEPLLNDDSPALPGAVVVEQGAPWRGWYDQYGTRHTFDLRLRVHDNGAVEGEGKGVHV